MRVVLLTSDTLAQRALAHRISAVPGVELATIVIQRIRGTRRAGWVRRTGLRKPKLLASKVLQRTVLRSPLHEILGAEASRFGHRSWPSGTPIHVVTDINSAESVAAIASASPDVVAVSGTRMIKAPVFDLEPPLGLLNLHTGISPFVRGGPNCTLWCLARGEPHLIGATVHVLDLGIDSGAIITTRQLPITGAETPGTLVAATMELGHDMYADVLARLAGNQRPRAVPQDEIGEGRTYYTNDWHALHLFRAVRYVRSGRLRRWVSSGRPGLDDVQLVPLEGESDREPFVD